MAWKRCMFKHQSSIDLKVETLAHAANKQDHFPLLDLCTRPLVCAAHLRRKITRNHTLHSLKYYTVAKRLVPSARLLELRAEPSLPCPLHGHALLLKHLTDVLVCRPLPPLPQHDNLVVVILGVGVPGWFGDQSLESRVQGFRVQSRTPGFSLPIGVREALDDAHVISPHDKLLNKVSVLETKVCNLLASSRGAPEKVSNRTEQAPLLAQLVVPDRQGFRV